MLAAVTSRQSKAAVLLQTLAQVCLPTLPHNPDSVAAEPLTDFQVQVQKGALSNYWQSPQPMSEILIRTSALL